MLKKENFAILIPARKGSKSIKNKNIIKLGKKKLVEYTFSQIPKNILSDSYVVTNDKKVKKIADKYNINSLYNRPDSLSQDNTSLADTIIGFHNWIKKKKKYDFYVILQPTSPLRKRKDIDNAIKIFKKSKSLTHFSVSNSIEHPYESVFITKSKLKLFFSKAIKYFRRQDFDHESYFINGAIYITQATFLTKYRRIYSFKDLSFNVMDKKNSLDLNDKEELFIINKILK
jgi:N-acylneuraminate cytidylyltransferase/CMP-N,N'-diacetyllegionaminic acid synthase